MKYLSVLLFSFLISCSTNKKIVAPTIAIEKKQIETNDQAFDEIINTISKLTNGSEIAVAVIKNNETKYYGIQRQNNQLSNSKNMRSVFEIGSITKIFTTNLLLNAIEDDLIPSIDHSITKFNDYTIKGNPNITFKQLANHSSGLPNNIKASIFTTKRSNPYQKWDEEKLKHFLKTEVKINSLPGEKYNYSNIGMAVLANSICQQRKKSYEQLLQEEIFSPLGMTMSSSIRNGFEEQIVQAYNWKGKPTENWDLGSIEGAGAILSTVEDLAIYLQWNFTALEKQLKPMRQSTKKINDTFEVALGWHIVNGKTNEPILWHNGGTGGYKASMSINLNNKTAVVILSNVGATKNPKARYIDDLCFAIMKQLDE